MTGMGEYVLIDVEDMRDLIRNTGDGYVLVDASQLDALLRGLEKQDREIMLLRRAVSDALSGHTQIAREILRK